MRLSRVPILVAAALLVPMVASAQDQQGPPQPPGQIETELSFEREVFRYPLGPRINPFRPLVAADEGGPRFEQLRLVAVYVLADTSRSLAVLGTGGLTIDENGIMAGVEGGESYSVRIGQTVGNVTVVEIRDDSIVVDVEEFGLLDRRIMELPTRGGTQ